MQRRDRAAGPQTDARRGMAEFESHFNEMVDLLCLCARDGYGARSAARYRSIRSRVRGSYGTVRYLLEPHVGQGRDPFEALLQSETLSVALATDEVIPVLQEARAAIDSWHANWSNP